MGRLIDACKVIEKINCAIELLGIASKTAAENEGFQTTIKAYRDVRDAIMREPTAGQEIIHCKDCKHYGRLDKRRFYRGMDCLNKHIDTIVPDVDFCSKAERRGNERPD